MEKNNTSSKSCVCKRIRHAIARSPSMKFFRYGSFSHQHASPDKQSGIYTKPSAKSHAAAAAKTDMIQRKSHSHQRAKVSDYKEQPDGFVPIKFDYTNPASNGNGMFQNPGTVADNVNNGYSTSMSHQRRSSTGQNNGLHGSAGYRKQGSDINDTFSDYIRRARMTIRTFSNAGDERNDSASPTKSDASDNTKDHFSDFIHRTRMRITELHQSLGKGTSVIPTEESSDWRGKPLVGGTRERAI